MRLTASNLVRSIQRLPRDRWYDYVNESTTTQVKVIDVVQPEGPIAIERKIIKREEVAIKRQTISIKMLWRVANAIREGLPISIDRVLGASYNTRSALEALLAHTPILLVQTRSY